MKNIENGRRTAGRRGWRRLLGVMVALLLIDMLYLWWLMPDWDAFRHGKIAKSAFIHHYQQQRAADPALPPLRWQAVPLSRISKVMRRAVIVAEDSNFYRHDGIDVEALQTALQYNMDHGRLAYGGSTISQQVAKNMLLSPSRNPLRKWHELWLTLALERQVPKGRILEIYLNVAEFGTGIYGVEAAARRYWGIPAAALSADQAAELAATLTSPKKNNPATRTRYFQRKLNKIRRHMKLLSGIPLVSEEGGSAADAVAEPPPVADNVSAADTDVRQAVTGTPAQQ